MTALMLAKTGAAVCWRDSLLVLQTREEIHQLVDLGVRTEGAGSGDPNAAVVWRKRIIDG